MYNVQYRLFQSSFTVINRRVIINDTNKSNSSVKRLKKDNRVIVQIKSVQCLSIGKK